MSHTDPLSVSDLFARYLEQQIDAHSRGLGHAEPGEDATPFDATPVQPVDPRLARVLIEAARLGALRECLVITAFLSIQDPRERPPGRLEAANERHASFADPRSDFVTVLNLWRAIGEQASSGSRALRRWCRENFLSWPRIREWQDLHAQLTAIARSGRRVRTEAPSHSALHRSLLSGFLGGIGVRDEDGTYLGARDTRFLIAPGSPLARRRPHWVMAASLDHTMWFHRDIKVDEWWLYVEDSPAAESARGLARGIIFDRSGNLCCSVAQEILLRAPLD